MRTLLSTRHLPAFEALEGNNISRIVDRLTSNKDIEKGTTAVTGAELFEICKRAGLDQARVVLALARETDDIGVKTIEVLVGKPIQPWQPKWERPTKAPTQVRVPRPNISGLPNPTLDMVVTAVMPNPKKPSSESYARFAKWKVGLTLRQCLEAGITRGDVKWDTERGFVTLADPSELQTPAEPTSDSQLEAAD
jgi:hypothetical protein